MITLRRAGERGHSDHGWLDSRHTFSFADYYDPSHMGYGALRVINDDRVAPGKGFGTHAHRDMEIVSYVLEGAIEHKDSMGNGSVIVPGDVQRMTAGTGVRHSEFNPSATSPVHFLQIWILPERVGLEPSYEQKRFEPSDKQGRLRLIASGDGRDGSVIVHQDARLFAGIFGAGDAVSLDLAPGRHTWVHLATGEATLGSTTLRAGDGAAIEGEARLELVGRAPSEVLVFDLA
jgi:redox-sensitive bicupin YhaK (pirin superfamily)